MNYAKPILPNLTVPSNSGFGIDKGAKKQRNTNEKNISAKCDKYSAQNKTGN